MPNAVAAQTQTTERINTTRDAQPGTEVAANISSDGRFVVFDSRPRHSSRAIRTVHTTCLREGSPDNHFERVSVATPVGGVAVQGERQQRLQWLRVGHQWQRASGGVHVLCDQSRGGRHQRRRRRLRSRSCDEGDATRQLERPWISIEGQFFRTRSASAPTVGSRRSSQRRPTSSPVSKALTFTV